MYVFYSPTPTLAPIATITPTPNPTTDWQTHNGENFSFKFQPNWTLEKLTYPSSDAVLIKNQAKTAFIEMSSDAGYARGVYPEIKEVQIKIGDQFYIGEERISGDYISIDVEIEAPRKTFFSSVELRSP